MRRKGRKSIKEDNRGVGVVEVVLILVILIGLVLVFKTEIETLVSNVFEEINGTKDAILK